MSIQWQSLFFLLVCLFLIFITPSALTDLEGKIGFVTISGDILQNSWDIHLMDPNGRNVELLTRTHIRDAYPTWSPDGRLIAVQDANEGFLHLLHLTDNQLQKLPIRAGHTSMTWSPDSRYLIYNGAGHQDDTPYRILDVRTESIFNLEGLKGWEPDWSPDGKHLVFNIDGNLHVGEITTDFQLVRIRKLTEGGHTFPSWSPNGKQIAFYDFRENRMKILPFRHGDKNVVRVHQTIWQFFEHGDLANPPTWSPDGSHLVFGFRTFDDRTIVYLASLNGQVKQTIRDDDGLHPYWIWKIPPQAVTPLDKQCTTWGELKRR